MPQHCVMCAHKLWNTNRLDNTLLCFALDGGGQTGLTCACLRISGVRGVGVIGAEFNCVLLATLASISMKSERDFFPIPAETDYEGKKQTDIE